MERRHHLSQRHQQQLHQQRVIRNSSSLNQTRINRFSNSGSRCNREEEEEGAEEGAIIGTCPFMCPEKERLQRQSLRDLAVFERLHGDPRCSSPALAVKKFCRTMSAKEVRSSDVRPLPVLEETLNHLLDLLETMEHPFEVIHDFVFDRTRSIRQDLSMQNIVNDKVINMYEWIVKFHVMSHHKLRTSSSDSSLSTLHHLNREQLTKALTSLYNLYEANRRSKPIHEKEAEFRSLNVLLHLDSKGQPMGESLSIWFRLLPSPILKTKEMVFARRVLRYFRMGNYSRFLRTTAAEASYLQFCIIEPYVDEVRSLALCCINNCGYKLHPYPLGHLSKLLMMEESDVELFCDACGLQTCTDEVGNNKLLPTKQATFCHPKGGFQNYRFLGFEQLERKILL